ncbi:Eukaryotic translation initiation factor 4 gamma 3 [Zootermopsis nevadensis]|uniref:Eukaryotic translation initiation factor 4 gamma 3 n=1 Tax=Zootermopsis nevadensis TaxID=136037 RepID=A0A067QWS9_ZOONE|nr:Eukaryotic translation initiation factor 4 gamma 3 [Zootermopsis nevadensis]
MTAILEEKEIFEKVTPIFVPDIVQSRCMEQRPGHSGRRNGNTWRVQSLPIDSIDRLEGVINLIFEKAVDEPSFSEAYARMCKVLSGTQVPAECEIKDEPEINFRKLLLNQ